MTYFESVPDIITDVDYFSIRKTLLSNILEAKHTFSEIAKLDVFYRL